MVYQASHIKRRRATAAEMEARAQFFIDYAERHGPVTVRGLYYQAEVEAAERETLRRFIGRAA